jgi:hypothetical protein
MSDEIIKKVRLRGKISTDGKFWTEPKPDNLGIGDIELTLSKGGRKDYFITFEPVIYDVRSPGPGARGVNRAYDMFGVGYPVEPKPSNDLYKTTDDFITQFVKNINSRLNSSGYGNPAWIKSFTGYYAGLTQSGLPPFYEIVQNTFDPDDVPLHPEGYFDIWNKWVEETKNPKPQEKPVTTTSDPIPLKVPALSGKILLKKKSGPGEITGITEIVMEKIPDVESAKIDFKEIQFTEPGDYVITVSSDNEKIEYKEISIKVLPRPEIIPQDEKNKETPKEENKDGSRPIITQIDPTIINIEPIKFEQDTVVTPSDSGQKPITDTLGFTPFIWYAGYQIKTEDLLSVRLYHDGIIPKLEFNFRDTLNILKGDGTPQDQTSIELFLNSTSENIKSIHLIFKIEDFDKSPERAGQTYTIRGTLDVPNLYITKNKSYKGTSFEVLREISKELELGFNSNITNADDSMTWRSTNKKPYEFIDDIIKHSYISDKSFMLGYIDYYYCFNYVDIEKEKSRNVVGDVVIDTSGSSKASTPQDQDRIVPLRLTNDKSFNSSSLFFEKYTTKNNSTKKSLEIGYLTRTRYYDRVTKSFLVFDIDSSTSDGKSSLILKGKQNDSGFFNENIVTKFLGKLDTDNMHKNYNYAYTQNRINLDNLTKIVVDVTLSNPNYCLYKYMKVGIDVINPSATPTEDLINYRYSGEYIISSISYLYRRGSLKQELTLVRSELGKNKQEMDDPTPVAKKPEEKQINENPVVPGTTPTTVVYPNSVYAIGEVLTVQDSAGVKYKLTVKQLLENGTEVLGNLEQI